MHQVVGEGPYASHMTLARSLDSLHTQVPQLTHLELKTGNGCGNECLVLAKLAALTGLRYAALPCTPQLPTAVSKLQLLTHLQLLFERSHAAVEYQLGGLGSLSQLQRLVLLQAKPAGEQIGVGLLLGEVGQLQHLTHLDIYNCSDAAASPTAYSALTASSSLQHLHLGGFCLPKGAWAHMFPGHRQLPALRKISHYQRKSGLYHVGDGLRGTVRMTPAELAGLVSCAPNLQQLNFPCMRVSAAALQPLSELTQLTELVVSTVNDAAAQAIASFPNLSVSKAYGTITVYGLKALIQLTRLTSLKVESSGLPRSDRSMRATCVSFSTSSETDSADVRKPVWWQLADKVSEGEQSEMPPTSSHTQAASSPGTDGSSDTDSTEDDGSSDGDDQSSEGQA